MAKYLKLLMVALFATLTFTITSCGDDDEPSAGNLIEINGKKWAVKNDALVPMGYWFESLNYGLAFWVVNTPDDNGQSYMFACGDCAYPKKGDDFAKIGELTVELTNSSKNVVYSYESGSAKILATDQNNEKMTIQYDNLKITNGGSSYTFNGTITIPWNFEK